MNVIHVDGIGMLAISIVVLFTGMYVNTRIRFLAENFIPPAVTGGLLCAIVVMVLRTWPGWELDFDMHLRDLLLLVFFSTVGLSVKLETLKTGGKTLPLLVVAAGVFLVLQNIVGVSIATLFDADPAYGLMAGSISFAGGHGTAIAWGNEFEASGLANASAAGLAFATFGLVAGGLIGGPVARQLITRFSVATGKEGGQSQSQIDGEQGNNTIESSENDDWQFTILRTLLLLTLCVILGEVVNVYISERGVMLPGFLTAMFVGIFISNATRALKPSAARETVDRFGAVCLQIFLAMSMMTVELWTLGGALQAITLVLIAQIVLMTVFAMIVIFFIAGRNYDAVVISAGFSGLGLGATPVAIANMNAVTSRYGQSTKAFLLIPLIGAFFIDILNAGTIQFFLKLLS